MQGTIDVGPWEDNMVGLTHTMWKNFTVSTGGSLSNFYPLNTIEFKGMDNAVLTYSSDAGYFHHLVIDKLTGISVTQVGNISCQYGGNLTVENGIFNLNGNSGGHLEISGKNNITMMVFMIYPHPTTGTFTETCLLPFRVA